MLALTPYSHVNALLADLLVGMQRSLGPKLVGLYLFGSLVSGDYDDGISDIDLLAALSGDIDRQDFAALNALQNQIMAQYLGGQDRLEIAYLSRHALQTFKTEASPIGIISPGEPFHIIDAGYDWLINWYMVRENGLTLFGPPPQTIIAPITRGEFIDVIKWHLGWWREHINVMTERGQQAYAILTLCRGLYAVTNGQQVSKRQAALWAKAQLPQWAALIDNALRWRQESRSAEADGAATVAETKRFVLFVIDRILG